MWEEALMEDDRDAVDLLNELLGIELIAINQYFVHSKMCEQWGYERLAHRFREASMEEMKDAEELMDRVLDLGGLPNLQRLDPFQVGETPLEQLELAERLEDRAVRQLRKTVAACEDVGDQGTSALLRGMLLSEEGQLNWLASQRQLASALGDGLYLAQQVRE
jgi:bacterioferritin